ncbi:hypothetical protein BDV93DRAFT_609947 [Ceratobasidium sp. AG-I]|nr:hypothetical protein BDV93DRAFT_609947 [Ceratobasidium sp. AG-I]
MKKLIRTLRSRTRFTRRTFRPTRSHDCATLSDLPSEILLLIFSFCITPTPLGQQPFWLRDIPSHVLVSPYNNTVGPSEQRGEQVRIAKILSLVCRRTWTVFMPVIWSWFHCSNLGNMIALDNACASDRELGSCVQYLELKLRNLGVSGLPDMLSFGIEPIWPKLTSLHSLTLTLSPNIPCPQRLAEQLQNTPTLRSLHLRVYGFNFGPHLRALPQLEALFIDVCPPNTYGQTPLLPPVFTTSYPADYTWTGVFNDVVEMVDACIKAGNLKRLGLFVHREMTDAFYQHIAKSPSLSNLLASVHILDPHPGVALGPSIKQLIPPNFSNLSRLSMTLESRTGTETFLRAVGGLPITDLALTSYDWTLLSGASFRAFCATFAKLRRFRLKLWKVSDVVGEPVANGFIDQDAFVQGLASLRYLESFKGPVLLRGRSVGGSLCDAAQRSLDEVVSALKNSGTLSLDVLLHWDLLFDEGNGPRRSHWAPDEPARLGDWKTASTEA